MTLDIILTQGPPYQLLHIFYQTLALLHYTDKSFIYLCPYFPPPELLFHCSVVLFVLPLNLWLFQ